MHPAVGVHDIQAAAGGNAFGKRYRHLQRSVAFRLQLLIKGTGHRAQGVGAVGREKQVPVQHQGVVPLCIGGPDDPHILLALPDLHLVQGSGLVVLVLQGPLQVIPGAVSHPPDLGRGCAQHRPRQAQGRAYPSGTRRYEHRRPHPVLVPGQFQGTGRRDAGKPSRRLGRPLQKLPPGQAVHAEGPDLIPDVGQVIQCARFQRHAAPVAHLADKIGQGQREHPLIVPQPEGQVFVKEDHPVVGRDLVDIGAGLGGLFRQEDARRGLGACIGVQAVEGQLIPLGNEQTVFRCPQFQLGAGRTGRPGAQVRAVAHLLGEGHAADGVAAAFAAGQDGTIRQQQFMFQHGPSFSTG